MRRITIILAFSILCIFLCVLMLRSTKNVNLDKYFQGYKGTFVMRDLSNNEIKIFNEELAKERIAPQSTFKVFNALVGLQTGVVSGENHLKKWDGTVHLYSPHNRDHTLASAIRHSVVWYFQDMARDIGQDRMQAWINQVGYGNKDISGGVDRFWLESSLLVSPIEQVDFITKLYKEELPFDKKVTQTVKSMLILKQDGPFVLAGKTGTKSKLAGGWFVGYSSYKGKTYVFSTYISGPNASGPIAREITEKILQKEFL